VDVQAVKDQLLQTRNNSTPTALELFVVSACGHKLEPIKRLSPLLAAWLAKKNEARRRVSQTVAS
jgi:hypothetical protein